MYICLCLPLEQSHFYDRSVIYRKQSKHGILKNGVKTILSALEWLDIKPSRKIWRCTKENTLAVPCSAAHHRRAGSVLLERFVPVYLV